MLRILTLTLIIAALSGCQCGGPDLIRVSEDVTLSPDGSVVSLADAGPVTRRDAGVVVRPSDAGLSIGAGWCATDCDCPANHRCVSTGGELANNVCQPGTSTCTASCAGGCATGYQCNAGTCELPPCVGTNCTSSFATSVQGTYATYYELDATKFAQEAGSVLKLLDLLNGLLNGTGASCSTQSTPEGQLMCFVVNLIGQNIHAPPWVSQLIAVLSDAFRFGNKPVRAKGVMQLAESQSAQLYAAETWSEMWLEYNGQSLNVMNSPNLGANGKVTVTVPAFKGSRTATEVMLGPRAIEFDVNKLLVNMLNVVISAASHDQAHDVGELLDLILCSHLSVTQALLCKTAADNFADDFELGSGLGGVKLTLQRATIFDLDGNNLADALALPASRGSVEGKMSNGLVSGSLGSFPASNWYGTK